MRPPVAVPRSRSLPYVVVVAWLTVTALAFAWLGPAARPAGAAVVFDAGAHGAVAERWFAGAVPARERGPLATVIGVTGDACACTRGARRHLDRLGEAYAPQGVAVRHERLVRAPRTAAAASGSGSVHGIAEMLEATPAALVFDARGRLVYYGPLSERYDCASAAGGPVERALDALRTVDVRTATAPGPVLAAGCYCARADRA